MTLLFVKENGMKTLEEVDAGSKVLALETLEPVEALSIDAVSK